MKPVYLLALCVFLAVNSRILPAQNLPSPPQNQQQAYVLLVKMLSAAKSLDISGEQETILYRPEQTFTASQTVERQGDKAMRIEYKSPQAVAGDVFVDNGKVAWHYIPSANKLEVGTSGFGRFHHESEGILRRLNSQQLTAQIVGQEVVAGQNAQIVQVTAPNSFGQRRYWIDPSNGAQLKIVTFGTLGQMVSQTYFTKISYRARFGGNEFGPPKVSPSTATVLMSPRGSQTIAGMPPAGECGFEPLVPSYVPPGFTFQYSMIMPMHGQKMVSLIYGNTLTTLSIFEKEISVEDGQKPPADEIVSPRQGVVTAVRHGCQYILVGNLPSNVMQQVLKSMH
jgi:outer membrane lipoprotein-sorting protein